MSHHYGQSQFRWQFILRLGLILSMIGWNNNRVSAAGTTYFVNNTNPSCSDAGTGSSSALPFCTIGKAASIAVAGDTIQVLAGTYAETVNGANSGAAGLPITYSAVSGVTVTGNGLAVGGNAFRISGKSYIVVDGFTITGTLDYGIYIFGSNNITITNNHVSNSGSPASGSTRMGIYVNSTTNSIISGNTSDHNSSHGILLTNSSNNNLISSNILYGNAEQWQRNANGIDLDGSNNNTIINNMIYNNEDSGVNIYTGSSGNLFVDNLAYGNGDHGFDFNNSQNGTVIGNTVQGNVTSGINFAGTGAPGSGGATVVNNIMVDNGLLQQVGGGTVAGQSGNLRFDANSLTGNTLDYNVYYLNSGTIQIGWGAATYTTLAAFQGAVAGQETNGLQTNPLFIAPASVAQRPPAAPFNVTVNAGDYHLTSGSPAIDSANSNAPNEPTSDIEGNTRVDDPFTPDSGSGTRTYDDRGAYEFQPIPGAALPTVTTQAVTNIAQTTATGNGNITDLGIPNPTEHGVVWSTIANPTIANNKTSDGPIGTTGAFTSNITGLTPGTVYHVRAYAWNAAGISYGNDVSFTTTATIYYVDKTNLSCSDAGPGTTPALPFCTLGKAASVMVAGNITYVLAGTYAETVNQPNSGFAGSPITYSASPGVTVTGNGSAAGGNAFRMTARSYIVVDGFTITGTADYGIYMSGSNHITISKNQVSDSGAPVSGSTRSGIYLNNTTNSSITGNTSDHNSSHGIQLTNNANNNLISDNLLYGNAQEWQRDASGIRLDNSSNNTMLHNIAYGNEDSGITNSSTSSGNLMVGNLLYGNGDHGIDNTFSPNNTVIGNTVHGNVTAGINFEGGGAPGSGGATVINNIMVDNGLLQQVGGGTSGGQPSNLRFDASSVTGNTLDYNLFYQNSVASLIQWNGTNYTTLAAFKAAVPGQEPNGLQADPLFIAPAPIAQRPAAAPFNVTVNIGNYHIQAGSPAIDSANSGAPSEPLLDLEGNARVDDPATVNSGAGTRTYDDRGVYEFQPIIGTTLPTVTTQAVTSIATTTATGNGTITDLGIPNPTSYGVVWSTALNPTIADSVSNLGVPGATGAFTAPITGLTPGTLYHVRAFATNSVGTAYGADVTFTALLVPTVTTQAVSAITTTTATGNGSITNLGVPNPTAYGVVWSTALNPTIADGISNLGAASATGTFTAPITGLTPGTLYHVRAFATNAAGTSYGADVVFTAYLAPTVTTQAVSNIGGTNATGNGTITNLGVPNPTAYGVVWSTALNPTIADSISDLGAASAIGAFTAPITGLTPGTLYHVRAFATNVAGTSYGVDVTFTTLLTPTVTTQPVSAIGGTSASGNGTIIDLGIPNPTAYGVVWSTTLNPTIADSISDLGAAGATGAFTAPITGLTPSTLYHVRAFATNTSGTSYGADVTFSTVFTPTVTTQAVSAITTTTATGNGTITDLGVPNPIAYGVVWSTTLNPTIADNVSDLGATNTTGAFTAPITGLAPGTLYHVRAFATNAAGTSYGVDVTFTTGKATLTVAADNNAIVYGSPDPAFTFTYSGFIGADTAADIDTPPTCTVSVPHTNVGTYPISCSGGVDNAYNFIYVDGTLTVTQATLTITANNQTISYGSPDPAFTFTYSGFLGTDTAIDIDTPPTCTVSAPHTNIGNYPVTCSGGIDNNYTFTYVNGTLTVNQATLTVTPDNQTLNYGDPDPAFTFTYSGFIGADTAAVIDTPPTCTVVGAHTNAGTYPITCSGGIDNNYTFTYANGTLTVNQVVLTVTADNQTLNYGDPDPVFTFTYSGFIGADTAAVIDTPPTCTVVGAHTNAGTYPITCSGGIDNNYTFTYVNGTLTINQVLLTVTADNQTINYGDPDPAFTFTYSGFIGADTAAVIDTPPTCTVVGAHTNAGTYPITCSGGIDNNYTFTYVNGTLNVVGLSVTANIIADNKVYDGTTTATFTCSLTGVLPGDNVTCTGGSASFVDRNVGAGKLVTVTGLTLSGVDAGSYSLSSTSASNTADITPRTLNVNASGVNKVYDGTTAATITLSDDRVVGDNLTITYAAANFIDPNVGMGITINVSGISISGGTDAGNYSLGNTTNTTTADITVRPASVTPNNAGKIYGNLDPAPLTTGTLTGFIPGDAIVATYTRVAGENVGSYTINATLNPAGALGNYSITYNTATFTISTATPTLTWNNPANITYGTPLSGTQLNATTSIPGTFTYTPLAGTVLNAGNNQNLHVDFVPNDTTNYNNQSADVMINVNKATLTVIAVNQSINYGDPDPAFTFTYSGFIGTDTAADIDTPPTCSILGTHTNVGTYPITCASGVDNNYTFNYVNGTLSVGLASQTITITTSAAGGLLLPGSTFSVAATASSGLPVVYSASGACTNVGAIFTMTADAPGVCTVLYNQPGNANIGPASQVTETANIALVVVTNGINSNANTGDNHLDELEVATVNIIQLTVNFNKDTLNPAGDTAIEDVTNPANYILVMNNGDGIQTSACNVGVIGGDLVIPVDSVTYTNNGGSGPFTATLNINGGTPLPVGNYRLIVCGTTSVVDLNSIPLAGNRLATGTDFIRNFSVANKQLSIPATGFPQNQITTLPAQPAYNAYASTDLWLEIPKLNVKMSIVGVPQTRTGWDITWLGNKAGWLNGSAFPTLQGNSVLTGHVWDALNNPGPFANLKNLKYGDQIKVHINGQVFVYEVSESLLISATNTAAMLKHEEHPLITLITCEDYRELTNDYAYRRMVRAVLVSVIKEK